MVVINSTICSGRITSSHFCPRQIVVISEHCLYFVILSHFKHTMYRHINSYPRVIINSIYMIPGLYPQTIFVTHSLGGIITRAFLEKGRPPNLGRVVMIAPPNSGSDVVDSLGGNWILRRFLGPAFTELGTSGSSAPNRLGPAAYEVGIIAGNRSWNPLGSLLIDGTDDGAVAVVSSRLEGMKDFLIIPAGHTLIMEDAAVIAEVLHFLREGRFSATTDENGVGQ